MKKLLILFLFVSSNVIAQTPAEKEIAANVESLRMAMIDANKSVLESLTAKELSYGHSTSKIENKSEFVEAILSGKTDFTRIDLSDQSIAIVDDIAIVRHKFNGEATLGGTTTPVTLNIGVLQIWKKQGNKWLLLARQGFKM